MPFLRLKRGTETGRPDLWVIVERVGGNEYELAVTGPLGRVGTANPAEGRPVAPRCGVIHFDEIFALEKAKFICLYGRRGSQRYPPCGIASNDTCAKWEPGQLRSEFPHRDNFRDPFRSTLSRLGG